MTDTDVKRDVGDAGHGGELEEELSLEELDAAVAARATAAAGVQEGGSDVPERSDPEPADPERSDPERSDPGGTAATSSSGSESETTTAADGSVDGHLCTVGFCPIGMALTTMEKARPDAVQHLLLAGREFLLAAKAVIDARAEDLAGKDRLQKIDVG